MYVMTNTFLQHVIFLEGKVFIKRRPNIDKLARTIAIMFL